jgi:hypothetical protein
VTFDGGGIIDFTTSDGTPSRTSSADGTDPGADHRTIASG